MEKGDFAPCPEPPEPFVSVVEDGFGFYEKDGVREVVRRYTFTNHRSLIIQVITYGATITSVKYPDKEGILDDVVLGFDTLDGYLSTENMYFGATIGRCANIITKGHFKIGDEDYQLSTNAGEHHLHGGFKGFDKVNWTSDLQDKKVVMSYLSKDGEEGYPGEVLACVSFEMTPDNDFIIEIKATSSKPTPINLTNHSYFNLAGHAKGAEDLYEHYVSINADRYCHTDEELIPTGMLKNVVNTLWDLRIPRRLRNVLSHIPYGGYDQNMCIHKTSSECLVFNARVVHPDTGRTLEVYSNQPGIQFYTGNMLPSRALFGGSIVGKEKVQIKGKHGVHYYKHQAFCLETQSYPDAVNHLELDEDVKGCHVKRCPRCGQIIRDPDFEMAHINEAPSDSAETEDSEEKQLNKISGKEGAEYFKHAGLSVMPQNFPDAVHRKNFPNTIIKPGETYFHLIKYKFNLEPEVLPLPEEEPEQIIDDTEVEGEEVEEKVPEGDDFLDTKIEENGR